MASEFVRALERIDDRLDSIDSKLGEQGKAIVCLETKMRFAKWILVAVPTMLGAVIGSVVAILSIAG